MAAEQTFLITNYDIVTIFAQFHPNHLSGTNTRDLNCLLGVSKRHKVFLLIKSSGLTAEPAEKNVKKARSCRKFNQFPQSSSYRRTSLSENTLIREPTPAELCRGSARLKPTRRRRTHVRTHDRNFIRDPKFFWLCKHNMCSQKRQDPETTL